MKIIFRTFPASLWRGPVPLTPFLRMSYLAEAYRNICILFVPCPLTQMNPTWPPTIAADEWRRRNTRGTKEMWVIRVEKCHFGSCCPPHWSVRVVIKSDSCTIDNAPPARPRAELPSTIQHRLTCREKLSQNPTGRVTQHQCVRSLEEWLLLAWLVLTLTPPNIDAKKTQQKQAETSH